MSRNDIIKLLLKVGITIILLIYLVLTINLGTISSTLVNMDLFILLACIPLVCLMFAIRAEKWRTLLRSVDINIPFINSFKIFLIGTFYGSLTPGRLGELSRSFFMGDKKSRTIPTIIIDRITDIICLLILSTISILAFFHSVELIAITIGLSLLCIVSAVILLDSRVLSMSFKLLNIDDNHKYDYMDAVDAIIQNKRSLLYAVGLTICYYAINILAFWLVLRALSFTIEPIIALSLPIIIILGNVPISISGLGVREMVSVSIFSMFGQSAAYGFSASLVLYLITSLIPGLIGLIFTLERVNSYGK